MYAAGDLSTPNFDEQSSPPPPLSPSRLPSRPLCTSARPQNDWSLLDAAAERSMVSDETSRLLFETPHSHWGGGQPNKLARTLATEVDLKKGKKCLVSDIETVNIQFCRIVDRATEVNIVSVFPAGSDHGADYHPFLPSFTILLMGSSSSVQRRFPIQFPFPCVRHSLRTIVSCSKIHVHSSRC